MIKKIQDNVREKSMFAIGNITILMHWFWHHSPVDSPINVIIRQTLYEIEIKIK